MPTFGEDGASHLKVERKLGSGVGSRVTSSDVEGALPM